VNITPFAAYCVMGGGVMDLTRRKIGLALSGGGIRAMVFHLGVLKWMAEQGCLENIRHISSASGGSLVVGLIYAKNDFAWPSSEDFLARILPEISEIILQKDLQIAALVRLFPFWIHRKVKLLARMIGKKWNVVGKMEQIAANPIWSINCTTYETGNRFEINQNQMSDSSIGTTPSGNMPIAHAMAASAGFPILIGPYPLRRDRHEWSASGITPPIWAWADNRIPGGRFFNLWDGGVYDNMGLEPLFGITNSGANLAAGVDFIIISNAGASSKYAHRLFSTSLRRLLDIAMDQAENLRIREAISHFQQNDNGMFLPIGANAGQILRNAPLNPDEKREIITSCLPGHQTIRARNHPTNLRRPTPQTFANLLRHGYETAKCTHISGGF